MKNFISFLLFSLNSVAYAISPTGISGAVSSETQTFDLMPTNDIKSLQAAFYGGMKALSGVAGYTGLKIERLGDSIYSTTDGFTHLTCLELSGHFACGFAMVDMDIEVSSSTLDIGASAAENSIQLAVLDYIMFYDVFVQKDALNINYNIDPSTNVFTIKTSTAVLTTYIVRVADSSSISFGMKIELIAP